MEHSESRDFKNIDDRTFFIRPFSLAQRLDAEIVFLIIHSERVRP